MSKLRATKCRGTKERGEDRERLRGPWARPWKKDRRAIIREIFRIRKRRDGQSPRNLSSFPERRTKRRLQGGPDRSGSERLDNYRKLHTDPPVRSSDVILRKLENDLDRERDERATLAIWSTIHAYVRAREGEREREREKDDGGEERGRRERERSGCTPSRTVTGRLSWLLRKQTKERNEGTSALGGLAPLFMGHCICWPRVTLRERASERANATCVVPPYVRLCIRFTTC